MRETHLNHEDGEDEQTDAVEDQSWIDSVGFTLCKKTHTGMFLVEQVDGRMKNYIGQEGKRKNQLLSGVEVSRRDWKSSGLRTELQLPDKGCFPTFPQTSFPSCLRWSFSDCLNSKHKLLNVGSPTKCMA